MKARIEPEAREELREAKRWYEEQRAGLGSDFVDEVRRTIERVRAKPDGFPLFAGSSDIRRAFVERFPYVVVYLVKESVVRILVVAHQRREPAYGERAAAIRRRKA